MRSNGTGKHGAQFMTARQDRHEDSLLTIEGISAGNLNEAKEAMEIARHQPIALVASVPIPKALVGARLAAAYECRGASKGDSPRRKPHFGRTGDSFKNRAGCADNLALFIN